MKLGATGDFPKGKLNEDDEGGLRIRIGVEEDNVRVDFGTSVAWFALPPKQAVEFAQAIIKHAEWLTDQETVRNSTIRVR
jgi:hypothetical protein